jgi:hypothetical protein
MCVYCKEAPGCDHERDACAASLGEYCAKCGHGSAAILSYTPGRRWLFSWFKRDGRTRGPNISRHDLPD